MKNVCVLWWEGEDGDWDFVGAYANVDLAEAARDKEIASDGGDPYDYTITVLRLEESK